MTPLESALRAIAAGLDRRGLRWALVGGLAVSARAEPRTTRDVDVLFASSGIEPEVASEAESIEVLPGLVAPVARLGHLVAMKILSRDDRTRPRDAEDVRGLFAEASDEDLDLARSALGRISTLGSHRGRDLAADLRRALSELR